jgi:hypothetical protein
MSVMRQGRQLALSGSQDSITIENVMCRNHFNNKRLQK